MEKIYSFLTIGFVQDRVVSFLVVTTKFVVYRLLWTVELEPEQELFLWAVLMRRKDLAMCFWEAGNVSGCCYFTAITYSLKHLGPVFQCTVDYRLN